MGTETKRLFGGILTHRLYYICVKKQTISFSCACFAFFTEKEDVKELLQTILYKK